MNTWLHSFLLIALHTPLLAAARWAAGPFASVLADTGPVEPGIFLEAMSAPLLALSLLLPGMLLGWSTRRHPLLVGAAVGVLGSGLMHAVAGTVASVPERIGDIVFASLVVAVAALAGRALRWRFAPAAAAPA